MKKYSWMIFCCLFLILALIFDQGAFFLDAKIGAGNGKNAEIQSTDELYNLLSFMTKRKTEASVQEENEYVLLAASSNSNEDSDKKTVKHSSVTIEEVSSIKIVQNGASGTFSRTWIAYYTEDASYYTVKGSSSSTYTGSKSCIFFDLDICMDDDSAFMRIRQFSVEQTEQQETTSQFLNSKYHNKWLEVPSSVATEIFYSLDSQNRSIFQEMGSYLKTHKDDFEVNGDIYTVSLPGLKDDDLKMTYDLSAPQTPTIKYNINSTVDGYNMRVSDVLTFSNIDNTVVELKIKPDYVFETEKEFERVWIEKK